MKKSGLIHVLCLCLSVAGFSQKYNFKNFSVSEGLTQSEIYAICEDQRGNLWFGSMGGGIVMYNGYSFKSFREEDGLRNNFVYAIEEDTAGCLWIATETGICTYNGKSFHAVEDSLLKQEIVARSILCDNSGNIWFGTENSGLIKYAESTFQEVILDSTFAEITIYNVFQSLDSTIWLGTDKGVCRYSSDSIAWLTQQDGLPARRVRAIAQDDQKNMWFATYGGGVCRLKNDTLSVFSLFDGLANNTVYSAFNDGRGNLWFGTAHGVSKYDGYTFKTYREKQGLAANIVVSINGDISGCVWFGTSGGGISRFDNERFVHYPPDSKIGRWVYSVTQAPNGNILMGTSTGGVTVYDGNDYSLLRGQGGFTESRVMALHYTADSTLWCGTLTDGAYKFKQRGFQHYSPENGLNSYNITSIVSDTSGRIFFSSSDSGIFLYEPALDSFFTLNRTNGLPVNNVSTVIIDKENTIWAGTVNGGLSKIDWHSPHSIPARITTYTVTDGLTHNTIKALAFDARNNIYIGTAGGGINVFDGHEFHSITKDSGLVSENIFLLLFDREENLWAGTELGVDKIKLTGNFSLKSYSHFGQHEGFPGIEVYRNSCTIDRKGNLWFGTINGLAQYKAGEDKKIPGTPKIHITGIRLFYERIENTKYADSLSPWYPVPLNLKLPYTQNNLTFEFTGIYHRNPSAIDYRWKLEGIDTEFSPPLNQREVTYSNLSPGSYRFLVHARNQNGNWSEVPAEFRFIILTPLWKRPWFIALTLLLIISIIWYTVHNRIKRIKRKNLVEQERLEMEKSIIELEQEAARLQMNPHFIFNSLNSIQGFIAVNDAFQAKRFLARFARLMRLILENAREEFVPLENELEILEHYLELEQLSNNNKFDFSIGVDPAIDPAAIEIPPMMLQPFLENAILHGIKPKKDKGLISFTIKKTGDLLVCEIKDNGVGRAKAQESKQLSYPQHKSTGISVTERRLLQYREQTGLEAGMDIIDRYDEKGNATGTSVKVSIPYQE